MVMTWSRYLHWNFPANHEQLFRDGFVSWGVASIFEEATWLNCYTETTYIYIYRYRYNNNNNNNNNNNK
jgi:hypothetical protein